MMLHTQNGQKFFDEQFIEKLKFPWSLNNHHTKSIIEDVNPEELVDSHGSTLLHQAVLARNLDMVEYLIDRGFEVDARNMNMDTPLTIAMKKSDERIVKVLLAANADVADLFNRKEGEQSLLQMRLADYRVTTTGMVPLVVDLMKEKYGDDVEKMAEILLEIENPLPRSMLFKNTTLTKYMLSKGCSVDDVDSEENTALHYAVKCMDLENVKLLLRQGAKVYVKNWAGSTPLHYYKFGTEDCEILYYLLDYEASIDALDDDGFSVASSGLRYGKQEEVDILLGDGVDLNETNDGYTMLHYMMHNKNPGIINLLEHESFDVAARDSDGTSVLRYATQFGNYEAVEFLLKHGADPNVVDHVENERETILGDMLDTCRYFYRRKDITDYLKCMELLLKCGADVQFVESTKKTLFDNAADFMFLRPIIAQVVLMKALNQQVNETIIAKIQSHEMFLKYFNICQRKMEKLKNTVIRGKVTLFTFLIEPQEKLLKYARNQESCAKLEQFLRQERRSHMYFVKILRKRIGSIVRLAKTRVRAALNLSKISGFYNPVVIDRIVLFLDEDTLKNVCQC